VTGAYLTSSELIRARTAGVFCHRVLMPYGDDGGVQHVLQLVATSLRRPATFNSLRVKPAHGPQGARQMAAGAHKMSDEIDAWRSWAAGHPTLAAHVEPLHGQVVVDVEHWRINRSGMPDVGAPVVAVKAVLDGLVDARILPRGDGPNIVRRLTFHAPEVVGFDGLRIIVTTLPGTEQAALDLAPERKTARS
jgi:hypothetical protein